MIRKQCKELLPIMTAWSEGATIQFNFKDVGWKDIDCPNFELNPESFRIKPEFKYRAFKDEEECWNEMLKHESFGWLVDEFKEKFFITRVYDTGVYLGGGECFNFSYLYNDGYKFIDGTPFGFKIE